MKGAVLEKPGHSEVRTRRGSLLRETHDCVKDYVGLDMCHKIVIDRHSLFVSDWKLGWNLI